MGTNNVWGFACCYVSDEPINCCRWLLAVVYTILMPTFVLLHVIIALSSVILSSVTFFKPSFNKLYVSYGFIIATVASGTYLIVSSSGSILRSCLTGLFYVTVVSIITIATHVKVRKLAKEEI